MKRWHHGIGTFVFSGILFSAVLLITGCEGTEARNQVDDTVEELAGKKHGERMKAMQEDLDQIQTQQAARLKQLDDAQ